MRIHEVLFPTFSHRPCPGLPVTRKELVHLPRFRSCSEPPPFLATHKSPSLSQPPLWPSVAQMCQPRELWDQLWEVSPSGTRVLTPRKEGPAFEGQAELAAHSVEVKLGLSPAPQHMDNSHRGLEASTRTNDQMTPLFTHGRSRETAIRHSGLDLRSGWPQQPLQPLSKCTGVSAARGPGSGVRGG